MTALKYCIKSKVKFTPKFSCNLLASRVFVLQIIYLNPPPDVLSELHFIHRIIPSMDCQ